MARRKKRRRCRPLRAALAVTLCLGVPIAAAVAQETPAPAPQTPAPPQTPPAETKPAEPAPQTLPADPKPEEKKSEDPKNAPPLPAVPQTTPPDTTPETVSPVTPGINLDAPAGPPEPLPSLLNPDTPLIIEDPENLLVEHADRSRTDAERRTIAEGNVRLQYRGYRIRADRATFDEARRIATLEGNVVIENDPLGVAGEFIRLNLRTRDFTSRNGQSVVPVEYLGGNLVQPLRVSGQTLDRERRILTGRGGLLTTCDFLDPHYRIGFRQLTVIPGRRIALRNAVLYIGDKAVLRLRYLGIPITDRPLRYSYLPQVGRTDEEGIFIKTALGYALGDAFPGLLRIDAMQKKGIGLGFDQQYQFGAGAAGSLLFYFLNDQGRDVQNLNYRLNHQQRIGQISLGLTSDYQQNSYQALTTNSSTRYDTLSLARTAGSTSTSVSFNLTSSDYGTGTNRSTSYSLTQSQGLAFLGSGGNATFRFNGTRYVSPTSGTTGGGSSTRDTQNGDLRVNGRVGLFDMELNANKNLSGGGENGGGFFSGTERVPEILFSTDTSRLNVGFLRGLPLRFQAGYGKFIENAGERTETDRALFNIDANPSPIPLFGGFRLQLGASLRQTVYGSDSAQYVLGSRSQLTRSLGPGSSLNFTYGYLRPHGFARLRSDQSGSFNNIGANLNYNTERVRLTLFTGYDIQLARSDMLSTIPKTPWQNLALQLALRPSNIFQTRFTSSYDINTGRLRDLTNRSRVRIPGSINLDTGLRYDPQTGKLAQLNAALETPLFGGAFNISAQAGYNGFTRRFEYKNFALTRSFHDYEITLTYNDQPFGFRAERGFNVALRLKALPFFQQTGTGQFGTALDTGTGEVF